MFLIQKNYMYIPTASGRDIRGRGNNNSTEIEVGIKLGSNDLIEQNRSTSIANTRIL